VYIGNILYGMSVLMIIHFFIALEFYNKKMRETYPPERLPCGGMAYFDHSNGFSYRCGNCLAVVGSIGMSRECQDLLDEQNALIYDGGIIRD
jgi:hypothetical protein